MSFYHFFIWGFGAFLAFIAAIVGYILLKFVLTPFRTISHYKNQGLSTYFYPVLGGNKRGTFYQKNFDDTMAYYRQLAQKDPNIRAEAVNFGTRVSVFLYDPKLIKEFYAKQSSYRKVKFSKGMNTLLGTGLVLAEGDLWKNHRKIISSIFHFEFLKENIPVVVDTTREFLGQLQQGSLKGISIMDEVQKITGEIVGRIFFGENLNKYTLKGQPLTLYLADLMTQTSKVHRNPFTLILLFTSIDLEWVPSYKLFMDDVREFRSFCSKIVQDRKASKTKGHDLLGLLLETQNAANETDRFSDEDIFNEFITFFVAGMDTTGHLITMALYLLYNNPVYIQKLQKEIKEIYDRNNTITMDDLNQMEMMHAVLKEALRFYTPAPTVFPRLAETDHDLGGIKIKKGSSVRPTPIFNYSNPKYFEEPEKFYPERWLEKKEQNLDSYVFIPFSAGARNCIGQHLSIIEAKIIIAEFLKRFDFKIDPEDYKLIMGFGFLYEPKHKIMVNLTNK